MGSTVSDPGGVLVIGYGNRLRGDDAVGPLVAEEVASWRWPGIETLTVHQLTPELALPLAGARRVVFVDAAMGAAAVTWRPVLPTATSPALGHVLEPGSLLGWAMRAFGQAPAAWLLTVPAKSFEVGAELSPVAQAGLGEALVRVRGWLDPPALQGAHEP